MKVKYVLYVSFWIPKNPWNGWLETLKHMERTATIVLAFLPNQENWKTDVCAVSLFFVCWLLRRLFSYLCRSTSSVACMFTVSITLKNGSSQRCFALCLTPNAADERFISSRPLLSTMFVNNQFTRFVFWVDQLLQNTISLACDISFTWKLYRYSCTNQLHTDIFSNACTWTNPPDFVKLIWFWHFAGRSIANALNIMSGNWVRYVHVVVI